MKALLEELEKTDLEPASELIFRCTLGELAVMAGVLDDWVRANLVKTLQDFDHLQPKDPSGQAVATQQFMWLTVTPIGTLVNQKTP